MIAKHIFPVNQTNVINNDLLMYVFIKYVVTFLIIKWLFSLKKVHFQIPVQEQIQFHT